MTTSVSSRERISWILSGQLSDDQPVRHLPIDSSPFVVGRQTEASLSIPSATVSRRHAELEMVDQQLVLRDLGSTNGTSVNGIRIEESCAVHHGDLIQFGQVVFRVTKQKKESILQTIQDDSARLCFGVDPIRSAGHGAGRCAALPADCRHAGWAGVWV